MGGGGDSRIPSLLNEMMSGSEIRTVVRTYDFDPEAGRKQIAGWVEELKPDLVIGESLGAAQAIRVRGIPHLFVSPFLGAPVFLYRLAWLTRLPGGSALLHRIWPVKEGDRQPLHFTFWTLRKYLAHRRAALQGAPRFGGKDSFFAFFGTRDHYRRSGVVSIRTWRKYFGDTYALYEGTHFMEEEFVAGMLLFKISDALKIKL